MRSQASALAVTTVAALLLMSIAPAAARPPSVCSGDVKKLCKDVEPGGGRVFACLREHSTSLSQPCKDALREIKQAPTTRRWQRQSKPWAEACMGDVKALCEGIPAGAGAFADCLKQHEKQLSPGCKAALASKPAK